MTNALQFSYKIWPNKKRPKKSGSLFSRDLESEVLCLSGGLAAERWIYMYIHEQSSVVYSHFGQVELTSERPLPHKEQTPVFCALSKCGEIELPILQQNDGPFVDNTPMFHSKFQVYKVQCTFHEPTFAIYNILITAQQPGRRFHRGGYNFKMASAGRKHVLLTGSPGNNNMIFVKTIQCLTAVGLNN